MTFLDIIVLLLTIAGIFSSFIVILGKNRWKRLLGVSMLSAKVNMIIIVFALITGRTFYLDIALVYTILSYIGVNVIADFMVERGKELK
ncbi:MAG: monovalent cation/H+ antiporter complex subunit F [Turicibacter sp.]|nr:monovalent cation/H+ antiporter complex subunit F [Turicibacter sp.]